MNALNPIPAANDNDKAGNGHAPINGHDEFLTLLPIVERHARVAFRGRPEVHREEAVAEAIAAAFESYVRLKAAGRDPIRDYPSQMAVYAVLHVKDDRHVGGAASSKDVLSHRARRKHGFQVQALPHCCQRSAHVLYGTVDGQDDLDFFEEQLCDNRQTPVPDQVSFRLDFGDFLCSLSPRDRKVVRFLAKGHSGKETARRFRVCPARISQLRHEWTRAWAAQQGEDGFEIKRTQQRRKRGRPAATAESRRYPILCCTT